MSMSSSRRRWRSSTATMFTSQVVASTRCSVTQRQYLRLLSMTFGLVLRTKWSFVYIPEFVASRPKLFEAWFLFTNVIRYLMDGREGEACDGCFLWYPYEQLTKHVMRNGSTI